MGQSNRGGESGSSVNLPKERAIGNLMPKPGSTQAWVNDVLALASDSSTTSQKSCKTAHCFH